ncbi:hypothetical protein OIV83_004500 [Microbotryomycetes sp. JL201]|nr:hypothetical protein OIV83_004500 [Microbotryomycetes sp. JL201]
MAHTRTSHAVPLVKVTGESSGYEAVGDGDGGGSTPVMAMQTVATPRLTRTNLDDDEGDYSGIDDDVTRCGNDGRARGRRERAGTDASTASSSSPSMAYYGQDTYSHANTPSFSRPQHRTRRASMSANSQSLSTASPYLQQHRYPMASSADEDLESSLAFADSTYDTALAPDFPTNHRDRYSGDDGYTSDDRGNEQDALDYEMMQQHQFSSSAIMSSLGSSRTGYASGKHFQALTGQELGWMAASAAIVLGLTAVAVILSLIG